MHPVLTTWEEFFLLETEEHGLDITWQRDLVHSLGHKAHFWDHSSPRLLGWGRTEPLGQALADLRALPGLQHGVPSASDGIILTVQDHPHGPVVGGSLTGRQHHRAPVPAGIKSLLGRGAEALKEGVVLAGSHPLILQ